MANTTNTAKFVVDNSQALSALSALTDKVGKTGEAFGKLKGAIAGLAIASFVADAYSSANALSDMAKAAGVSTQALLGFRDAVKSNGGEAQAAVDSMGKFSQAIEGAASGSLDLQDKFLQLGISLSDLRTMSEEQLLSKVIQELGKGEGNAQKMALAISFFGKSFKSVDFQGVANDIKKTTEAAGGAAAGFDSAGQAQQNFQGAISKLQTELLKALDPISKLAIKILDMSEAVSSFIKIAVQIGLVIASFTLFGKAIMAIRGFIAMVVVGFSDMLAVGSGIINIFRNLGPIAERLFSGGVITAFKTAGELFKHFGVWAYEAIPGLAALGGAIAILYENALKPLAMWLGKVTGLVKDNSDANDEAAKAAAKAAAEKAEAEKKAAREIQDALQKQIAAIRQASEEFSKQNAKIIDNINLENSLIGKTKEYQDVTKAQEEIFRRAADEADKLRDAKDKLSDQEKRRGLGAEYDKQIAKINELAQADAKRVAGVVENTQRIEMADKLRLFGIQNQIDKENQLQTVQDNIAKSTMTEIEKKYYDIERAATASAKAAIQAEEARIGRKLTADEAAAYYKKAKEGTDALIASEKQLYDESRKFSTGWKNAFQQYADDANNAAKYAERIFQTTFKGIEDLIVNFAKTGKFEMKNFVNSILEELLRSNLRQTMAQIFTMGSAGGAAGGGGLWSGFKSLLGFANGGVIPTNGPVLVGERGPELLTGAAGRGVVPNDQLGGQTVINYNISAVDAMSFKQMISRDPQFLYAVSEQGRRSLPGGR
jgi:lambda family phage tail tape measure protein